MVDVVEERAARGLRAALAAKLQPQCSCPAVAAVPTYYPGSLLCAQRAPGCRPGLRKAFDIQ